MESGRDSDGRALGSAAVGIVREIVIVDLNIG